MKLSILLLFGFLALPPGQCRAAEVIEETAECKAEMDKCFGPYDAQIEDHVRRGCKPPAPTLPKAFLTNLSDDCVETLSECKRDIESIGNAMTTAYGEMKRKCAKGGGQESGVEISVKGGLPKPAVPTIPVIKAPEKIYFDLTFKVFLSGREECKEKEAKARSPKKEPGLGVGVDDYTLFCRRFYPEVDGLEGDKGNNPLEISNRLAESEKAGLRFGKARATLEFTTIEECVAGIKRLDLLHGNIVAFFSAYSKDLSVVCQAIRDGKLNALWQLQTGSKPRSVTGTRR